MNYFKTTFLCVGVSLMLLQSCAKDETGFHSEKENSSGTEGSQLLKLSLQLKAVIKQPGDEGEGHHPMYEFSGNTQVVVLLRSSALKNVMVLPCEMNLSSENSSQLELAGLNVPMEGVEASPSTKWEMMLLVGGEWNEESERVSFSHPVKFQAGNKRSTLAVSQPYLSDWIVVPTDADGHFVVGDNEQTNVTIDLHPKGMVMEHRIASCKSPSNLVVNKLEFHTDAMSFEGYYDLSDHSSLNKLSQKSFPAWIPMKGSETHEVSCEPYEVKNSGNSGDGYIYVWGVPMQDGKKNLQVVAEGYMKGNEKNTFSETVFDKEVPFVIGTTLAVESSVEISGEVDATGPIVLKTKDGKNTLLADDEDAVAFVVEQGGVDVTSKATVYWFRGGFFDSEELTNKTFTTSRSGEYQFYAKKDGEVSQKIVIQALPKDPVDENGNLLNGMLFCKHVSKASGWHDVNKVGNGQVNHDGLLCWAAAASNMLQWWLEDFKEQGNTLPESVPFGKGKKGVYNLHIFEVFYDSWLDRMHTTDKAVRWFMEGGGDHWGSSNGSHPTKPGKVVYGGYFKDVLPPDKESAFLGSEYVRSYGAYYGWETNNGQYNPDMHKDFSRLVIKLLSNGISSLAVDSHELTLWGCEVVNGLVVKVYITNSDDGGYGLKSFNVIAHGGSVHLQNYPGKTNRPTQIFQLTGLTAYRL